jgi:hypothetical protein
VCHTQLVKGLRRTADGRPMCGGRARCTAILQRRRARRSLWACQGPATGRRLCSAGSWVEGDSSGSGRWCRRRPASHGRGQATLDEVRAPASGSCSGSMWRGAALRPERRAAVPVVRPRFGSGHSLSRDAKIRQGSSCRGLAARSPAVVGAARLR